MEDVSGSPLTSANSDGILVSSSSSSEDPKSSVFVWFNTTDNPRAFFGFTNLERVSFGETGMSEACVVFRPRKDDSVGELADGLCRMRTVGDACPGGSVSAGGELSVLPILRLDSTAMSDGMSVLTRGPNRRTNESRLWLDVVGDAGLASMIV